MSLQFERLELLMQRLSLSDMVQRYASLAEQAAQKNLPYGDFLEQILESEFHARQERNTKVRTPPSRNSSVENRARPPHSLSRREGEPRLATFRRKNDELIHLFS
jgi:DNA replication protein DnaC